MIGLRNVYPISLIVFFFQEKESVKNTTCISLGDLCVLSDSCIFSHVIQFKIFVHTM